MDAKALGAVNNYWMSLRPSRRAAPALRGEARTDVAIIGAGFTGLASAFHIKAAEPSLAVTVLEAETVGFGASGRNAGFVMTLFGASSGLMKALHGKEAVKEAHRYMERSIDTLDALIKEHALDCDFVRGGFLKVATSPRYVARIKSEIEAMGALGIDGFEWLDENETRARVASETFLGACLERHCGLINPVKWVDALSGLAAAKGAILHEGTPVRRVMRSGGKYRLETDGGTLLADKVVYATNGYTHLMPGLKSKQIPAFAYIIVTEKLTDAQRRAIGWQGLEGVEDGRNFMHFYRMTPDGRLLVGGGPGQVPYGGNMNNDAHPKAWNHLADFIAKTFPALRDVPIAYRWGGAFSVTADSTPHVRAFNDGSAVYSIGCTGHGVAMTHMNGQIVRDLILERKTDLTDLWFVNRRALPLPPEPLRSLAVRAATTAMKLDDWWCGG